LKPGTRAVFFVNDWDPESTEATSQQNSGGASRLRLSPYTAYYPVYYTVSGSITRDDEQFVLRWNVPINQSVIFYSDLSNRSHYKVH